MWLELGQDSLGASVCRQNFLRTKSDTPSSPIEIGSMRRPVFVRTGIQRHPFGTIG